MSLIGYEHEWAVILKLYHFRQSRYGDRFWLRVQTIEATRNSRSDHYFIRTGRQIKLCAPLLIQLQGCGNIQLNDLNLSRPRTAAPMVCASVYG
jgi:hypothetical protein